MMMMMMNQTWMARGFPLPMVKPRVPSGILGPFTGCPGKELPKCDDVAGRLRVACSCGRCFAFPLFFDQLLFSVADELSSPCTTTTIITLQNYIVTSLHYFLLLHYRIILTSFSELLRREVSSLWLGPSSSKHTSNSDLRPFISTDFGCMHHFIRSWYQYIYIYT